MLLPNSRFKLHKHRIKPPARANEALIKSVETACDIRLPDEFKQFYRFSDGFETVEDLFNMIPLSEIIDRKLYHNGILLSI
jgi:cell wall assembly regulator SMI1